MAEGDTYFFVDGSSLLGDIHRIRKKNPDVLGKKLDLLRFYDHFAHGPYGRFVGTAFKRFSIYFVRAENRLSDCVIVPDFKVPNSIDDFCIEHCGKKLEGGKRFQAWVDKFDPPQYVLDRINKSEKAVDTQICCDAMQLAANNHLDRLFLYSNDYDFIPLLESLKRMGANVSLFRLTEDRINKSLVENADSFCVPDSGQLRSLFVQEHT